MNVCELTLVSHPHRSRIGTIGWGTWRMLRCVHERSRSSSHSQLWVAGSLSPYNVIIYFFCTNSYCIIKLWHSFLYHDSPNVWDLVPAHLVIMFTPGSLKRGCDTSPARSCRSRPHVEPTPLTPVASLVVDLPRPSSPPTEPSVIFLELSWVDRAPLWSLSTSRARSP
jgi:hypothetical protein